MAVGLETTDVVARAESFPEFGAYLTHRVRPPADGNREFPAEEANETNTTRTTLAAKADAAQGFYLRPKISTGSIGVL
jgi:hypothetical protein